jgi:hypothetical protein
MISSKNNLLGKKSNVGHLNKNIIGGLYNSRSNLELLDRLKEK